MENNNNNNNILFRYSFGQNKIGKSFTYSFDFEQINKHNLKKILFTFNKNYISKTFPQIINGKNSVSYTPQQIIDKFGKSVLKFVGDSPVWKLRLSGQSRIYGIIEKSCFYIFAYDPGHKIKG